MNYRAMWAQEVPAPKIKRSVCSIVCVLEEVGICLRHHLYLPSQARGWAVRPADPPRLSPSAAFFPALFPSLSLLPSMLGLWLDRIKANITCISA